MEDHAEIIDQHSQDRMRMHMNITEFQEEAMQSRGRLMEFKNTVMGMFRELTNQLRQNDTITKLTIDENDVAIKNDMSKIAKQVEIHGKANIRYEHANQQLQDMHNHVRTEVEDVVNQLKEQHDIIAGL